MQVDEHGEVAGGQAVAVPGGLGGSAAAEDVDQGEFDLPVGVGDADQDDGAGQVAGVEGLGEGFRAADGVDDDVGAVAVGEGLDAFDGVLLLGVDGVGGAELAGPFEFSVVDVDGDDRRRPGEAGTGDGGVADPAAADDGDGVAAADLAGVDRGAETGHDSAAEQPGDLGFDGRVDLGALPGGDEGFLDEGADAQGRGKFLPGGEGHLLAGVVGVEAVPGFAALAGAAVPAHGAPVEDDEVTGCEVGDAVADGFDDPGGFVAEQEGEVVVDAAFAVVQVGVADPAGLDRHDGFTRPGVGDHDRLDRHRVALLERHDSTNLLRHPCSPPLPGLSSLDSCRACHAPPTVVPGRTPRNSRICRRPGV